MTIEPRNLGNVVSDHIEAVSIAVVGRDLDDDIKVKFFDGLMDGGFIHVITSSRPSDPHIEIYRIFVAAKGSVRLGRVVKPDAAPVEAA